MDKLVDKLEQEIVDKYTFNGELYFRVGKNKLRLNEILKMLYDNYRTIASRLGIKSPTIGYEYSKYKFTMNTNSSLVIVHLKSNTNMPPIDIIMEGHKTKVMAQTEKGVKEIMNNELRIVLKERKFLNFNF